MEGTSIFLIFRESILIQANFHSFLSLFRSLSTMQVSFVTNRKSSFRNSSAESPPGDWLTSRAFLSSPLSIFSFKSMTDKEWDAITAVHITGSYACAHAAWPHMRKQKVSSSRANSDRDFQSSLLVLLTPNFLCSSLSLSSSMDVSSTLLQLLVSTETLVKPTTLLPNFQ